MLLLLNLYHCADKNYEMLIQLCKLNSDLRLILSCQDMLPHAYLYAACMPIISSESEMFCGFKHYKYILFLAANKALVTRWMFCFTESNKCLVQAIWWVCWPCVSIYTYMLLHMLLHIFCTWVDGMADLESASAKAEIVGTLSSARYHLVSVEPLVEWIYYIIKLMAPSWV